MSSSKKPQTIGFWYRPAIHFGMGHGPIDAFLEFRGGDRPAWRGKVTESGRIYIDAMNLWGGESSEGGIAGYFDLRFGEADQPPSEYLGRVFGPMQPGYRGVFTGVFEGGRYGAMNPYPKPASFKYTRIVKGWDDDECWYPEKAEIVFYSVSVHELVAGPVVNVSERPYLGMTPGGQPFLIGNADNINPGDAYDITTYTTSFESPSVVAVTNDGDTIGDTRLWVQGGTSDGWALSEDGNAGVCKLLNGGSFAADLRPTAAHPRNWYFAASWSNYQGGGAVWFTSTAVYLAVKYSGGVVRNQVYRWTLTQKSGSLDPDEWDSWIHVASAVLDVDLDDAINDDFRLHVSREGVPRVITTSDAFRRYTSNLDFVGDDILPDDFAFNGLAGFGVDEWYDLFVAVYHEGDHMVAVFYRYSTGIELIRHTLTSANYTQLPTRVVFGNTHVFIQHGERTYRIRATRALSELVGMNPAHMIYDSLVSVEMQGEPAETINNASFMAAADRLFSERFGLCTEYDPDQETVEAFRQRICNVIAARCSRSRVDGLWYLDLIRDEFDIDTLPVLTDDDILEFEEQPSTLDDAVNQVSVEWFDPDRKEQRTTPPLQALGAIMASGTVNPELVQFPEIPYEGLALRVGARELHAKGQPLRKHNLVCNRRPATWRIGQRFRIMAPRHGIADMVSMVGDVDAGTLRSGAVRLVAVQDAYSMPEATYLVGQPPEDSDDAPRGAPQQRLVELPYVELAATLTNADLAALPEGVGYIGAIATAPTIGLGYSLYTHAAGEEFGEGTLGSWCPAATVEEPAGYAAGTFAVAAASNLSRAPVGSRVLWEQEEAILEAIDSEAGTITLGRGVADTVPVPHAPGAVLYFYDDAHAVDGREYAEGETVSAKLLTRAGALLQDPGEAPTLTLEITGRAHRPYPPGVFRINGEVAPAFASDEISLTWGHRDRLLQADQLVTHDEAGLASPEAGTTYTVRWYLDGVLDHTHSAIAGTAQAYTPSGDGLLRIELEAERDGLASHQMHVRELAYTVAPVEYLELEADGLVTDEADNPITLE